MRTQHSRIIPAEEVASVEPFSLGSIDPPDPAARAAGARSLSDPAARDDSLLRQSFEIGYRRGFAEAQARAEKAVDDERLRLGTSFSQRLNTLLTSMQIEFQHFDEHAAERVVDLAVELARRMVGDTYRCDRQAIVPVAREALDALAGEVAPATLRLNPDDLAAVSEQLGPLLRRRQVDLEPDPTIALGGCLLSSDLAEVDARIDERWRRIMAAIGRPPAGSGAAAA